MLNKNHLSEIQDRMNEIWNLTSMLNPIKAHYEQRNEVFELHYEILVNLR